MSNALFKEFEGVSSKAWKQKIQFDLKGADYNDTLVWKTNEGIDVKPFYHSDTLSLKRPINKEGGWKIGQTIEVSDTSSANKNALEAIARGAESIQFIIDSGDVSFETLFKNIDLKSTSVSLNFLCLPRNINSIPKSVFLQTDIIHHLAKTGNWFNSISTDFEAFASTVKIRNHCSINLGLYQNAGASMVQQLAYALAHANEYLNYFDQKNTTENKAEFQMLFNVSVGSNYFFEIAKLRALRQLWACLAAEYGLNQNCKIAVKPTKRNKTIYDYNVNLLRTTTECMSAIIGGADAVYNMPYDALYHHSNEFGDRISRNQLLILKHESYFDKVNNPADGAYYIESITEQLSEKALQLFKDIESQGGFLKQLKEGTIQRKIKECAAQEQADFDSGKLVLLGTNKYPNKADKMKDNLETSPFLSVKKRKTLIAPIIEKRWSERLETKRLHEE